MPGNWYGIRTSPALSAAVMSTHGISDAAVRWVTGRSYARAVSQSIDDPGDTTFLEQELVDKLDFAEENDRIWGKKVVTNAHAAYSVDA